MVTSPGGWYAHLVMASPHGSPRVKRLLIAGALLLAGCLGLLLARRPAPPEPVYQGKPLSAWVMALNSAGSRDRAEEVIRSSGSNAVPSLVRMLRTPDPVLARPVRAFGRHAPNRLSRMLYRAVDPFSAPARRALAAQALRVLGPQAQAALPALTDALAGDQTVSWHAALTLAQFGQVGVDALLAALPRSRPEQAGYICYALGTQGYSATNAVPALAALVETAPPQLAEQAANALGALGKPAVPRLLQSLRHPSAAVRVLAAEALAKVGPPARDALPRLIELAKDDQPLVRRTAISVLPSIRPSGQGILEVLTNATEDPDAQVRAKALEALRKLEAR
jgi:HEAT repeat protein